jgi:hypothetical protein
MERPRPKLLGPPPASSVFTSPPPSRGLGSQAICQSADPSSLVKNQDETALVRLDAFAKVGNARQRLTTATYFQDCITTLRSLIWDEPWQSALDS